MPPTPLMVNIVHANIQLNIGIGHVMVILTATMIMLMFQNTLNIKLVGKLTLIIC